MGTQPQSGPEGGKSGRGKGHKDGWTAKRIKMTPSLPITGGKADGYQVIGSITRRILDALKGK